MRLRLTDNAGTLIPLIRVGGEGGLLDNAVMRAHPSRQVGDFDTQYDHGEIMLPPGSRADVVAAIPARRDRRGDDVDGGLLPDRAAASPISRRSRSCISPSPERRCRRRTRSQTARRCAPRPATRAGPRSADRHAISIPRRSARAKPGIGPWTPAITFTRTGAAGTVGINGIIGPARHAQLRDGRRIQDQRVTSRSATRCSCRSRTTQARTIHSTCTASRSSR